MRFGSWNITGHTIEWSGQGFHRFIIETELLLETIKLEQPYQELYKWIVLATEEDWITDDELYDLNFAFVYAAGALNLNLDYKLFDRTLEYQFNILDEEEESQP